MWDQPPAVADHLKDAIASVDDLRTLLCSCEMCNAANAWKARRTRLVNEGVQLNSNAAAKNGGVDFDDLDSF